MRPRTRRTDRPGNQRQRAATAITGTVAAGWRAWGLVAAVIVVTGCAGAASRDGRTLPSPVQLPAFAAPMPGAESTSPAIGPSSNPVASERPPRVPPLAAPTPRPTIVVVRPSPVVIDGDDERDDDDADDPDDPDDEEPDDDPDDPDDPD